LAAAMCFVVPKHQNPRRLMLLFAHCRHLEYKLAAIFRLEFDEVLAREVPVFVGIYHVR
jgi:hypothetical protein